jgi:hypothetical protein
MICPFSKNVQTGSGAHPAFCSMSTVVRKAAGGKVKHSPTSSAEVKNQCIYTSVSFICLYGVDSENFTAYFTIQTASASNDRTAVCPYRD